MGGSYYNDFRFNDESNVISDDKADEKTGIFFPSMFPTISVVDSDLMMSVPPKFTAYQGMDAFFHASETVVNKYVHPMAEMFALKTIEFVAKYLPRAVKDGSDKEARGYMALANDDLIAAVGCDDPTWMRRGISSGIRWILQI